MQPTKTVTLEEATRLNRHQRRAMGKANNIKIVGTSKPFINTKKKKSWTPEN